MRARIPFVPVSRKRGKSVTDSPRENSPESLGTRIRVSMRISAIVLVTMICAFPPAMIRRLAPGKRRLNARIGSRCCGFWARALCALIGVRRSVHGAPPRVPCVVTSNHVSYLDILVLSSLYPSLFVANREIASWPVFGWITRNSGTLFVDRERPRDVVRAGREMDAHIADGTTLTLFPEGGTSRGNTIRPFMPSLLEPAAKRGAPCFAVSLSYSTPGAAEPPSETVCWWGGAPFVPHFTRLLRLRRIVVDVHFAEQPVISSDRKELARLLREGALTHFQPVRQADDYSLADSQTSAPRKSQSSLPSSQLSGSGEKTVSVK